ncbi:TIGR02677 family protein [Prauserella aidingensis]|uniref:TIGR02677 family protein n=1 Tax=Prauserella aidingensis TaxID=387890 RepID=UPI0020A43CDF|nr:TIGR02677 family protein [Prauserella aidingensis]MCP2253523.1 TIGR02677 family protein [Prauserella aidingensis]
MTSDYGPFAHLNAPNAELYRDVMKAFVVAKQRFTVHLRPEDVQRETGREYESVTDALGGLVKWGNLRADPDTSRVTTVEEFHRARFLYQLTPEGEAAEQALTAYDEALGNRGALQAVALTDIATQLKALLELAGNRDPDPAKVDLSLRSLVARFTDLADNAQAFMSSLQRTIDLHDADIDAFAAYKDRLIEYLERFIKDLAGTGSEIARLVTELEAADVHRLLGIAAHRDAEDAAPGRSTDDAPQQREFERGVALWSQRWAGFRGWFLSDSARPSQARLLRERARAAIPQLLQVVQAFNARRSGRSDRSADFRTLALWFAEAPWTEDLHRLWRAAFGLSSSRHLSTGPGGIDDTVAASTSWADAPPLEISPHLRKTGAYERRGRPNRVLDRSESRRHLAELAAQEAAETAAARAALATGGPVRLAEVGRLDPAAFQLFLTLLGDALAARGPDRKTVDATTADGTMRIRLTQLDDGSVAEIPTPHGVFSGPDHVVDITDLTADAGTETR